MTPFPLKSKQELAVEVALGEWCERDIFKRYADIETMNINGMPLNNTLGGPNQGANQPADGRGNIAKGPLMVSTFLNIMHRTDQEIQNRNQECMDILKGRYPHRVRIIRSFERPAYMPNKLFFDCLWNAIQSSERQLCEDHLGAKATKEFQGGYRKAFKSLQKTHGYKFMDDLLRAEVNARLFKVALFHNGVVQGHLKKMEQVRLSKTTAIKQSPMIQPIGYRALANPESNNRKRARVPDIQVTPPSPLPQALGYGEMADSEPSEQRVKIFGHTITIPMPPVRSLGYRQVENPEDSWKRAKTSHPAATAPMAQMSRNTAMQSRSTNIPMQRKRRASGLRKEVLFSSDDNKTA